MKNFTLFSIMLFGLMFGTVTMSDADSTNLPYDFSFTRVSNIIVSEHTFTITKGWLYVEITASSYNSYDEPFWFVLMKKRVWWQLGDDDRIADVKTGTVSGIKQSFVCNHLENGEYYFYLGKYSPDNAQMWGTGRVE